MLNHQRNHRIAWTILGLLLAGCSSKSTTSTSTDSLPKAADHALDATSEARDLASGKSSTSPANSTASTAVEVFVADSQRLQSLRDSYKGRVVVLDIWSTSCLPCMKEFPHLVELAQRWPEDVVCISLNVDYIGLPNKTPEDHLPAVKEFLASKSASSGNLVNLISQEADEIVFGKYDVEALPAILVYDRTGNLAKKLTVDTAGEDGLTYAGDVIPLVEQLIESR